VIVTSAVAHIGLDELAGELLRRVPPRAESVELEELSGAGDGEAVAEHRVFRPAADRGFRVQRVGDGSYRVSGRGVERLVARYDLDNEDALAHLERRLRGIGVISELESKGFQAGDAVEIAGVEFDLDPSV
jgi:GTP-binding protein